MTFGPSDRPVEILLVEDNPGDVELTQRVLQGAEVPLNIAVAEDGEVAMAYLRREGKYANSTRPDLIILDLNMPKKDGYEVLGEMNGDPNLRGIPVMVLTSTQAERARLYSYGISPSGDLWGLYQKPIDLSRFNSLIKQLRTARPGTAASPSEPAS